MSLIDHLDLSGEHGVLGLPTPWRLLLPPPGVVPTAGYAQLEVKPLHGEASAELLDQAKPFAGSCVAGSTSLRQSSTASSFCCAVKGRRLRIGLVTGEHSGGQVAGPTDVSTVSEEVPST